MNDLHDLLEDLSTPEHDLPLDGVTLLAHGRRRVRRRRLVAGTCLSLVGVGVSGVGLVQAEQRTPDQVADEPSYAALDLTPLSTGEVEARCASPLHEMGVDGRYTIVAGTAHQTPRPWHVGSKVLATPDDRSGSTACTVPETTAPVSRLTMSGDPHRLKRLCSSALGIDLSGWEPVAAAADGFAESALYRSGNGFLAECQAQKTMMGVQPVAGISTESAWYGSGVCSPTADRHTHCFGVGRLADHGASAAAVRLPSGRVVRTDAVDGYWAIAVADDDSPPGGTASGGDEVQPFTAAAVP